MAHAVFACLALGSASYRILAPQPIPFISYPFERAFSQLKRAAVSGQAPTNFTTRSMLGLVEYFASAVNRLTDKVACTTWADDDAHMNYTEAAMAEKHRLVAAMVRAVLAGQAHQERRILPLVLDLSNSSGAMG